MKQYILKALLPALVVATVACNRNATPAKPLTNIPVKGYDTTQYNLLYADATRQKMLGNISDAVVYFEQALRINPGSDGAAFQLSQISAMRGDLENAARYGSLAAKIDPNNSWYLLNASSVYYMAGKKDSVIYYYEKVLEMEPDREDLLFNLGNLYIEKGLFRKAEAIFEGFREKYGEQGEILLALVNLYREEGRNSDAEMLLKEVVNNEPDNPGYLGLLAEHYRHVNEKDKAIAVYNELFEKDPDNELLQLSYLDFLITGRDIEGIKGFINTVMINENVRKEDRIALFNSILEDEEIVRRAGPELEIAAMVLNAAVPMDPQVTLTVADVYRKVGNNQREVEVLKQFIERDESNYFIWERLLFLMNGAGDTEELYSLARRSATLFNRAPLPKLMLAFAASQKEENELALSELRKVRILVNEQPEFMVQILILEADIYYRNGDYDRSFELYDEALTYGPDDPLVLNNYAYFLSEQDRELDKAYMMIRKCLEIEHNATYADTEAWVLYKMGKAKKARKLMEEIEKVYGINDPDIAEHFGYIMSDLKECAEASKWWSEAMALDAERSYLKSKIDECYER